MTAAENADALLATSTWDVVYDLAAVWSQQEREAVIGELFGRAATAAEAEDMASAATAQAHGLAVYLVHNHGAALGRDLHQGVLVAERALVEDDHSVGAQILAEELARLSQAAGDPIVDQLAAALAAQYLHFWADDIGDNPAASVIRMVVDGGLAALADAASEISKDPGQIPAEHWSAFGEAERFMGAAIQAHNSGNRLQAARMGQQAVERARSAMSSIDLPAIESVWAGWNTNLGVFLSGVGRRHDALAPSQEAVDIYRRLADTNPDAYLPELAMSLNNLGARLSEVGRHNDALAPSQEAVDIQRRLADTNPDAYLPDLAASLNNLGAILSEVGRRNDALAPSQEAVDIYRRLADTNPDAYLPDLAMSLNNLGAMLSEVGRRNDALAPSQEAVDIYRRLADTNPDAYLPDLAMSLNNLGAMLSEVGRRNDALAPSQEAVDIYRRLADTNPDAYLPNLAASLNNLGAMLSEVGRRNDSLAPSQEAVDIRRRLADTNPDAYLPDLAGSLNNLGARLSGVGRRNDALAPSQEGVDIRRRLADTNPDAYLPDLAMSLNNLGARLSEVGRRNDALAPSQEGVDIYRRLADTNPDAYLPNLAGSLNNLGAMLSEVGRHNDALAPSQEAVDIRRRLADTNPDAYLPDLAGSLNNLGARLSEVGRPEDAERVWGQAVNLLGTPVRYRWPTLKRGIRAATSDLGKRVLGLDPAVIEAVLLDLATVGATDALAVQPGPDQSRLLAEMDGIASVGTAYLARNSQPERALELALVASTVIARLRSQTTSPDMRRLLETHPRLAHEFQQSVKRSEFDSFANASAFVDANQLGPHRTTAEILADIRREPGFDTFAKAPEPRSVLRQLHRPVLVIGHDQAGDSGYALLTSGFEVTAHRIDELGAMDILWSHSLLARNLTNTVFDLSAPGRERSVETINAIVAHVGEYDLVPVGLAGVLPWSTILARNPPRSVRLTIEQTIQLEGPSGRRGWFVAQSHGRPPAPPLPGAAAEAEWVAQFVGAKTCDDHMADLSRAVLDAFGNAAYVHIACHGSAGAPKTPTDPKPGSAESAASPSDDTNGPSELRPSTSEASRLVSSTDEVKAPSEPHLLVGPGFISLSGIELAVRSGAPRFVALTACSVGRTTVDEQAAGIPTSLLSLGVEAVLAPLWPIGDIAANGFIVRMYERWESGASLGEAHRFAIRWALDNGDTNIAGLQLFGNPDIPFVKSPVAQIPDEEVQRR